jgi:hypothetical protein
VEWKDLETKNQAGSLMLCGIGISHSDVPALLARSLFLETERRQRVYDLICGCRQIDLSTMAISQFSSKHAYFSYPKSKASLYQKYLSQKQIDSGSSVWSLYDDQKFNAIERRCKEEVDDALSIYKAHFDWKAGVQRRLARLKWFERNSGARHEP